MWHNKHSIESACRLDYLTQRRQSTHLDYDLAIQRPLRLIVRSGGECACIACGSAGHRHVTVTSSHAVVSSGIFASCSCSIDKHGLSSPSTGIQAVFDVLCVLVFRIAPTNSPLSSQKSSRCSAALDPVVVLPRSDPSWQYYRVSAY